MRSLHEHPAGVKEEKNTRMKGLFLVGGVTDLKEKICALWLIIQPFFSPQKLQAVQCLLGSEKLPLKTCHIRP